MENAVDILDPTFYDTLASINARHEERLREAEAELDAKAQALLPKYREIFFAQDEKDHSADYLARIEAMMADRDQDRLIYEQKLQAVESEYQRRLSALNREESLMQSETDAEIAAVQSRIAALESQFRLQASQAEKDGEARIKAHRDATAKTIQRLTEEYVKSLKSSQGTIEELSQDFRKVLDGYTEYKRFAERDSGYRKIVRSIRKAERKRLRVALRQLDTKFRKYRIDAKKA
jgi:pyruvate/2-oxoacid:ferredoxin oxidoreductase alpha subunit